MNKILACIDTRGKTDAVIDWAASAHLQSQKGPRLVQSRRDGKRIVYRLSGPDVAQLGVCACARWPRNTWSSCDWLRRR